MHLIKALKYVIEIVIILFGKDYKYNNKLLNKKDI